MALKAKKTPESPCPVFSAGLYRLELTTLYPICHENFKNLPRQYQQARYKSDRPEVRGKQSRILPEESTPYALGSFVPSIRESSR